ncbi:MAG: hypothetical protein EXR45_00520 [Chloroflexi bacterium]|nr:hypothetical protein [Chloroflexota bacterium]
MSDRTPAPLFDAPARHRLVTDLDTTFVVDAGAGTGKTHTLVTRIVSLVANGRLEMGALAAITFTEASAAELRDRIRGGLDREATNGDVSGLARDRCRLASGAIDEASIRTIHAFCGTLLRTFPLEASLPPGFATWDTLDEARAFDETFRAWLRDEPAPGTALEADLAHALRLGLNPEDLRGLASRYAEVPVPGLAQPQPTDSDGAPSDPERGVLHPPDRDAPAPVGRDAIEAVVEEVLGTFAAIDALLPRARKGDEDRLVRVVEGFASDRRRLRYSLANPDADGVGQTLALISLVRRKVSGAGKGSQGDWDASGVAENPVVTIRRQLSSIDELARMTVAQVRANALRQVLSHVDAFTRREADRRRAAGITTFQDLLTRARDLLRDNPEVRRRAHARWQRLFVDEFQDTDPLQAEIAWFLCASPDQAEVTDWRALEIVPGRLFVVGDPKQSIYRFRRADIAVYNEVYEQLAPKSGGVRVELVQNFRSLAPVLAWVNDEFGTAMKGASGIQATYIPLVAHGSSAGGRSEAGLHQGSLGVVDTARGSIDPGVTWRLGTVVDGPVSKVRRTEATDLGRAIRQIVDGGWMVRDRETKQLRPARFRDICILMATRTGLGHIETGLTAHGVPYRGVGGALVAATAEIRDLISCLRAIHDPSDQVATVAALRSSAYACTDSDLLSWVDAKGRFDYRTVPLCAGTSAGSPVADALASLHALHHARTGRSAAMTVEALAHERMLVVGTFLNRQPREAWRRVRLVVSQARTLANAGLPTLRDLVEWFDDLLERRADTTAQPPEGDEDAVRLMTVHGAKGLEFPIVFLTGLDGRQRSTGSRVDVAVPVVGALPQNGEGDLNHRSRSDGQGEIEARCGDFQTLGYAGYGEREKRLLEAERIRLEYVAATRACDHLILLLHRRAPSKSEGKSPPTAAARIAARLDRSDAPSPPLAVPFVWQDIAPAKTTVLQTPVLDALQPWERVGNAVDWINDEKEWADDRTECIKGASRRAVVTPSRLRRDHARPTNDAGLADAEQAIPPSEPDESDLVRETPGGDPAEEASESAELRTRAQARGTIVHQVLERINLGTLENIDQLVAECIDDKKRSPLVRDLVKGEASRVITLVRNAARSPFVATAVASGRLWRELPLGASVDGVTISGVIDLLHEAPDGSLAIADFKTDVVRNEIEARATAGAYEAPGGAYALALEAITGRPVSSVSFIFAHLPDGHTVTYQGDELRRIIEMARDQSRELHAPTR